MASSADARLKLLRSRCPFIQSLPRNLLSGEIAADIVNPMTGYLPMSTIADAHPYWGQDWGQAILRGIIRPVAERIGIKKWIGWHTLRHTYSTLLRSVGTEFKVMQELMRHSPLRSTIDIYTQAVTPAKHAAQAAVLSLFFAPNRIARFNPRSKKRTSDKTAA